MTETVSLAYVVPTKDRPKDLAKLLDSIRTQTRMPDQIIVVDGSDPVIKDVVDSYPDLPVTYVREFPPSLARQRNAGMAALRDTITVAGYLDDDIVLEPDATERMATFWKDAGSDVGGASFSIINQGTAEGNWLESLFMMHGPIPGAVLRSGFPVQIPFVEQTIKTEWLYGGATIWRRSVIERFSYDEWFEGHGFLEDLDYSFRVSRQYALFVVGDARVWHFSSEIPDSKQYDFGCQQLFNRIYFVRKNSEAFPRLMVSIGILGTLTMNGLALLRHLDKPRRQRFLGNLRGLAACLSSRRQAFSGHWKK